MAFKAIIYLLTVYLVFTTQQIWASNQCTQFFDKRDSWTWNAWGEGKLKYKGYVLFRDEYQAFREAAELVKDISGSAPVIGMGRSPAPVTTFLSILKNEGVANLAMSDFRSRPAMESPAELPPRYQLKTAKFEPLSKDETAALFSYFDRAISNFLKDKRGTIFLVDVGESGASLFALKLYLDSYVAVRGYEISFETILITTPFFSSNVDAMGEYFGVRPHKIVLNDNKYITETLKNSPWDRFAEYESFDFETIQRTGKTWVWDSFSQQGVELGQGRPNPAHKYFRVAVHANMLMDPTLSKEHFSVDPIEFYNIGITWDSNSSTYRDVNNDIVPLTTD